MIALAFMVMIKWILMAMGAVVLIGIIILIAVTVLDYQVDKIVEDEKTRGEIEPWREGR